MEENGINQDSVVPVNFDELLTEQVRIHPSIYNPHEEDFKKPSKKEDIWNEIADTLDVSVELCCSRWRTLRERYVKKKKTILEYPETAARILDQWALFSEIEDFLSPFISHRKKAGGNKATCMEEKESGSDAADSPVGSTHSSRPHYNGIGNKYTQLHSKQKLRLKRRQQGTWSSDNNCNGVSIAAMRALASIQKPAAEDEEAHFGHIVAATLRRLPPRQRAQTKLVIYQILVDSEFPPVSLSQQAGAESGRGLINELSESVYIQVPKDEPE